jgi:hypothetical protein
MVTRRKFMKTGAMAGAAAMMPWGKLRNAFGVPLAAGLSDPALQPKFAYPVPNALDPGFIFDTGDNEIRVGVGPATQQTGLVNPTTGGLLYTPVWGYGQLTGSPKNPKVPGLGFTWPGRTFQVRSNEPLEVRWENRLGTLQMPVTSFGRPVIDTSLHWAYSLHGYTNYSIEQNGVPIVAHVHGGHSDF